MGGLSKFEECPVCGEELSWEDRREFSFEPRRYRSLTTAEARGVGVVRFWDDGRKYSFEPRRYRGHAILDVWKNMNPEDKEKLSSGLATSFQDWLSLTPIDQATPASTTVSSGTFPGTCTEADLFWKLGKLYSTDESILLPILCETATPTS